MSLPVAIALESTRCPRCHRPMEWDSVQDVWVHAEDGWIVCRVPGRMQECG